jgi:protein O-mannosyl-transferase
MGKKHNKPPYKFAGKESAQAMAQPKLSTVKNEPGFHARKNQMYAAGVLLIVLVLYIPSLFNGFIVNWDDGGYIQEHDLVHNLNGKNIAKMFNPTTFYKGNYHPLTTLTYAIEYNIVKKKASGYSKEQLANPRVYVADNYVIEESDALLFHINNLIFHLLNVLLVFWLVRMLFKRVELAAFVALFFGIHPMHVESVAWISERKDVLYTFFFLLSCITYYFYLVRAEHKTRNYILSVVLLFLSLLSKSAAVALPGALLLIDYWLKRKFSLKLVLDKIPFVCLSLVTGILAVFSQSEKGAIQDLGPLFSPFERIFLVCDNVVMYLAKLFAPFGLAAMYPYPAREGGHLPIFVYSTAAIVLVLTGLVIWSKKYGRQYIFGFLFFIVTIILVLQILPVGGAMMSERYTYVPYIGIFLILGMMYTNVWKAKSGIWKKLRMGVHMLVAAFAVMFFILSWQRIALWKDGDVLFTDLIKTYPTLPFGYNNRGYLNYRWLKNNDKALADFTKAISIDSTYYQAWGNRGVLYYNYPGNDTAKYTKAIHDFTVALRYKPDDDGSLIGRANTLSTVKRFAEALPDYNKYLPIKPDDTKAWMWRGTALFNTGKTDEAMADFEKSASMKMNLKPEEQQSFEAEILYWKGLVFEKREDHQKALELFNTSIQLNPKRAEVYGWRGIVLYNTRRYEEAIADYTKAVELNPMDAASFVNRAIVYNEVGKYKEAFADLNTAGKMGYALNRDFFFKVMAAASK